MPLFVRIKEINSAKKLADLSRHEWFPYGGHSREKDKYGGTFSMALPLKSCSYDISRRFFFFCQGSYHFPIWNTCDLDGLDSGSSCSTPNHFGHGEGPRVKCLIQ